MPPAASSPAPPSAPRPRWWPWALLAVGLLTAALPVMPPSWQPWPLRALDAALRDQAVLRAASSQPETRIAVIDIDESSLQQVAPWPWPRERLADLLETLLSDYRVRAVGVDIVFPAPADRAGDERLAAMARVAPVALAQVLDFAPRRPPLATGALRPGPPLALSEAQQADLALATGYLGNHTTLADAAACTGHIGIVPGEDGRIRHVPLVARAGEAVVPLLPLALWACPLAQRPGKPAAPLGLPGMRNLAAWPVPFTRHWAAYDVVPAADVLARRAPPEVLRGRWVLVGSSALGLNDRSATPLASSAASVMVHASVLSSLLDAEQGWRPWPSALGPAVAALWIALTLVGCAVAMRRWRAWWILPGLALSAVGWLALATALLPQLPGMLVVGPLLAAAAVALLGTLELWRLQRAQGRLMRFFSAYVAPQVVAELVRRPAGEVLQPQRRDITVVCADLEGYSRLTADSTLPEAAELTRELLQRITEPVWRRGGTLDKYTGDGLVAFWGAPLQTPDHAEQAVRAAHEMAVAVQAWSRERAAAGRPRLRLRVGVESGAALVGDLGSRERSTYTAVGDCINHASKLQDAARSLRQDVIIGPHAASAVAGRLPGLDLQLIGQMPLAGHALAAALWSFAEPSEPSP